MAFKANINSPDGKTYNAKDVPIDLHKRPFYCSTPGCRARMTHCNGGSGDDYFRSLNINEHISPNCIKKSVIFKHSEYDENRFDLKFAFESMLSIPHNVHQHRTKNTNPKTIGGGRHNRIHTLPLLYALCLHVGKSGTYNGFLIDDILADDENYERYSKGIEGYKLVETSMFHKVKNEYAIILNYPCDNRNRDSWVRVNFENVDLFWTVYNRMKNSSHLQPIIISGDWFSPENKTTEHHSECNIISNKQIYWVSER